MSQQDHLVSSMRLSSVQRASAYASGGDVAVTAGAGAGKTSTLVARYLSLLDEGLSPRQVTAITFTRKAAREMRNRVREQVRLCLRHSDLSSEARDRWQGVYSALDAARIGTIHSLCAEILRHHPVEAGLDPRFEMLDEGQMALLSVEAVDQTLAWAADDEAGVCLFSLLGERNLRGLLAELLRCRLDAAMAVEALPGDPAELEAYWARQVAACRAQAMVALLADGEFDAAWKTLYEAEPLDPQDLLVGQRAQALAALGKPEGQSRPEAAALAVLDEFRLNVGSARAWWGDKEERAQVKEALRTLRDLWRDAAPWATLAVDDLDRTLAAHYPALHVLVGHTFDVYRSLKAQRPALDFDDLEAGALRLLREHPPVCAYWQDQICALLVDEFQDTNGRQRDLLDLLNPGGGKLFIVGDGKQSIYRFRGADVTVFRQTRQAIAAQGQVFDLAVSYRAHQGLVEVLNALLAPVLGNSADPARPFVEPFAPLEHARVAPPSGLQAPFVEFHLALGTKKEGALDHAAEALAARLVRLVEEANLRLGPTGRSGAFVPGAFVLADQAADGTERGRALDYGDIAILCRASRSFAAYENALERAGVPFLTVAGRGFYDRPEVRDVLNAMQALADPLDDLALAGLLRSPACGLSDMALYRLAEARRTGRSASSMAPSLWAALAEGDLAFLDEEAAQGVAARELIARLHRLAGRVAAADVLKDFLDSTDYGAILLRAGQARGARNVAKLLADAHASQLVGIDAFLQYVHQLRDAGTREGEAHTVSAGAVQIMSVHAAKGLEFPVVVIGDAGRREQAVGGLLIDPVLGILPPLDRVRLGRSGVLVLSGQHMENNEQGAVYRLARRSAQEQDAAESDRLLYVAMTRARELLLISGVAGGKADGWLKRLATALPLDDLLAEKPTEAFSQTLHAGDQPVSCHLYPLEVDLPHVTAHTVGASHPDLPPRPPLLPPLSAEAIVVDEETAAAAVDPARRVWRVVPEEARARAPSWVVGKIVHRALECWTFPDGSGVGFEDWAAAEARGCGITDEAQAVDAVRRAAATLARFQSTPLYERMAGGQRRFHEVAYCVLNDEGQLEYGIIDALVRERTGWLLVEFKTDWTETVEELLQDSNKDYVGQVARYLAAAERLLGERPKPMLCLLNCAGSVCLVSDRWQEA